MTTVRPCDPLPAPRPSARRVRLVARVLALGLAACERGAAPTPDAGPSDTPPPAVVPADAFLSGEVRLLGALGDVPTAAVHVVARGIPGTPLVAKLPVSDGVQEDEARVLRFALDGRSAMLATAVPRSALPATFDLKIAYTPDGLVSGIVDSITVERSGVPLDSHDLRYELRPPGTGDRAIGELEPSQGRPPRRRVAPPEPIDPDGGRR